MLEAIASRLEAIAFGCVEESASEPRPLKISEVRERGSGLSGTPAGLS